MTQQFQIAGGSITGRAHTLGGRPNQDAYAWHTSAAGLFAVVCDGCGSGRHSEVGAKLAARMLTVDAEELLPSALSTRELISTLRVRLLAKLSQLARSLSTPSPGGALCAQAIADYLLFTVVGVVVRHGCVAPFYLGDGLIVIDQSRRELGPFAANQPPYLGYALASDCGEMALSPGAPQPDSLAFVAPAPTSVSEVTQITLATDGANELEFSDLEALTADGKCFKNRDIVRRRLVLRSRRRPLADDTTVIAIRKSVDSAAMELPRG